VADALEILPFMLSRWRKEARDRGAAGARGLRRARRAVRPAVGHVEPTSRLPQVSLRRGARLEAFRRLPPELPAAADAFLSGDSTDLPCSSIACSRVRARDVRQPTSRRSCGPLTTSSGRTSPPCVTRFGRWDAPAACPGTSATRSSSLPATADSVPSRGGDASRLSAMSVRDDQRRRVVRSRG
jgi:hypothetical protein